ncbi:Ldh family oxidoreductase [Rubrimonas cliftonensis]|uniref:Malate/lactate/ureidoglycolate dehydrogenase, LDH2 family n=1 Tax=Rubrimonas cliftonensis TaxID=89524 RepID=A0A1H3XAL4_9RHOB|nr:Ldh family oxidoreductase [Rubrimonas cliftonensis]SDZ96437.1 Malate/lactate/ureidoglycolate dehydrogenase, LDH2 family [Rubrimonas cliftonensis]
METKRATDAPAQAVSLTEAEDLAARAFQRAGAAERPARAAARVLAMAEAMGVATHGLIRVGQYCDRIAAGGVDPAAAPRVETLAPALLRLDGGGGLGPAVAARALEEGIAAARRTGVAAVFCRGGSHFGAIAPYLWEAAEAGFAAVVTTTTSPMIAPAGGRAARLGNTPLGIGVPDPNGAHVLFDMALSVAARARVRKAAAVGEAIPQGWAIDAQGEPTTDPRAALSGVLLAIGGDKGATLSLMLDLLAAGLSGGRLAWEGPDAFGSPGARQDLGHMFLLIDAGALMAPMALAERLASVRAALGGTPARPGAAPIRMPGDRALAALRAARRDGLTLPRALLEDLRARAAL